MRFEIFFLLIQYIFYKENVFANANPIYGQNARQVEEREFSSVVSFKLINPQNPEPETDHGCTGTLISKKHVLSTAHYLEFIRVTVIEVIVGSIDIRSGTKFNVSRMISYNSWSSKLNIKPQYKSNDIIIAELTENVSDEIIPAILSPLSNNMLYGLDVIIAGWGRTERNIVHRYMRTATLKILAKLDCKNRIESIIKENTKIPEKFLCTSADPPVFLRSGDSGGPLFLFTGELIGINKATCPLPEDNFNPVKVNLHLGIDAYRDFIQNVTCTS